MKYIPFVKHFMVFSISLTPLTCAFQFSPEFVVVSIEPVRPHVMPVFWSINCIALYWLAPAGIMFQFCPLFVVLSTLPIEEMKPVEVFTK